MEYQVIFKESFLKGLERLIRRVAAKNPSAALKLGEVIVRRDESLKFFPTPKFVSLLESGDS